MGQLSNWTKKNAKFFKLEDGESAEVVYQGFSFVKSKFDQDKEVVRYMLKTPFGVKAWDTSAATVANFFDAVKPGQKVTIARKGTGTNTTYHLDIEK